MKYNPNNMFGHYPEGSFWPGFAVRSRSDIHVAATEAVESTMVRYCQMADHERGKLEVTTSTR